MCWKFDLWRTSGEEQCAFYIPLFGSWWHLIWTVDVLRHLHKQRCCWLAIWLLPDFAMTSSPPDCIHDHVNNFFEKLGGGSSYSWKLCLSLHRVVAVLFEIVSSGSENLKILELFWWTKKIWEEHWIPSHCAQLTFFKGRDPSQLHVCTGCQKLPWSFTNKAMAVTAAQSVCTTCTSTPQCEPYIYVSAITLRLDRRYALMRLHGAI